MIFVSVRTVVLLVPSGTKSLSLQSSETKPNKKKKTEKEKEEEKNRARRQIHDHSHRIKILFLLLSHGFSIKSAVLKATLKIKTKQSNKILK